MNNIFPALTSDTLYPLSRNNRIDSIGSLIALLVHPSLPPFGTYSNFIVLESSGKNYFLIVFQFERINSICDQSNMILYRMI